MFEQAWRLFRTDIALDIGSARTRVWVQDQGLSYDEPTLVITEKQGKTAQVVAMGNAAKQYVGRTPPSMTIHRPVVQSICAQPTILESLIRHAIQQACGGSSFLRPKILLTMPHGLSATERKTYIDILYRVGSRESVFVDNLLCAGLGSKLPINEPIGSILLHIGHGSSQIGVMTLSGISASKRSPIGGYSIDQSIVQHLRTSRSLEIGVHLASEMKESIGTAESNGQFRTFQSAAKNIDSGQFHQVEFSNENILPGIQQPLLKLVETVKKTVSTISPEMCADIIQNGLMLSGGVAQLTDIDDFLSFHLRLPVFISDQPHLSPLRGAGELLNTPDLLDWLGEERG